MNTFKNPEQIAREAGFADENGRIFRAVGDAVQEAKDWAEAAGMAEQDRQLSVSRPLSELYALWEQFGSVPVTVVGRLEEPFYGFPAGAAREEVWQWFEERNPRFIVGEVMQGIRHTDECMKLVSAGIQGIGVSADYEHENTSFPSM